MADEKRSGSKGIPHHPLVAALASDPSKPPEKATKLFGYPGPAAEKGSIRLWLDTDLTSHVDVHDEAILHSQTLPDDQGTWLWVDPEAKLTVSSTQSHQVQAEFLGGSIAERNLAAAAPVGGIGGGGGGTVAAVCSLSAGCSVLPNCSETFLPVCPSVVEICGETVPTVATICPTFFPDCPPQTTMPINCPTIYPRCRVSLATQCPTVRPVLCQIHSRVEICPTPTVVEPASRVVLCPTLGEVACRQPTEVTVCCGFSDFRCPTVGNCVTVPCGRTLDCEIIGPFRPREQ